MNRKKITSLLTNILLFIFSVAFVFIIGELFVRVFYPQTLISDLMEPCPVYGLCMKKNTTGYQLSKEYDVKIRLNNLGFRGEDFSLEPNLEKKRILVVGDSFVFGYGVNENETLSAKLGGLIGAKNPQMNEVLNFGQMSFGTAQELIKFQEIGLMLSPSLVVLNVYLGNDLYENKRLFELNGSSLNRIPPKITEYERSRKISKWIPFSSWLRENSHLFRLIGLLALRILERIPPPQQEEEISDNDIELYKHILSRFKDITDERGIRLVVTLIPYHVELDEYLANEKPDSKLKTELKYYRESVKLVSAEMNLPVLDFFECFSKNVDGRRRHYNYDPHWNSYGNEQAAIALYDFLITNGFIE